MLDSDIHAIVAILRQAKTAWRPTAVGAEAERHRDPFRVLIATLISTRTKDEVTGPAAARLFALADTPAAMLQLSPEQIARTIYPAGFYQTKAANILAVCRLLVEQYGGRVPDAIDELVKLPGVGRKVANLVVTVGYGKPGICVDTHVHRITNRLGYVKTKTPAETEIALRGKLPPEYWIEINDHLVAFGQNICHPTSPLCSRCPLVSYCDRVGVTHSR